MNGPLQPGSRRVRDRIPLVLVLPALVVAGLLLVAGARSALTYLGSEAFCISCHEMEDTVYGEYQLTTHYRNASGVRAGCSDCHVPGELSPRLWQELRASSQLLHALLGTVDTVEKFEARRLAMAQRVWSYMEATDSRECRSCHAFDAMDPQEQGSRARRKHARAVDDAGRTCISCHRGIVHKLPEGWDEAD